MCGELSAATVEQVYKRVNLERRNEEYQVWGEFEKEPSGVSYSYPVFIAPVSYTHLTLPTNREV